MTGATPKTLSLITVSTDGTGGWTDPELREAGPIDAVRRMLAGRKEVSLDKIQRELERVQDELDGILAKISSGQHHGFHLSEVEISLAISGEGSIGVVTAGVEAGITLHFTTS